MYTYKKNGYNRYLTCQDFEAAGLWSEQCCQSCHIDNQEYGQAMCVYHLEPQKNSKVEAEICCKFKLLFHSEKSREHFAKAIVAKRKKSNAA